MQKPFPAGPPDHTDRTVGVEHWRRVSIATLWTIREVRAIHNIKGRLWTQSISQVVPWKLFLGNSYVSYPRSIEGFGVEDARWPIKRGAGAPTMPCAGAVAGAVSGVICARFSVVRAGAAKIDQDQSKVNRKTHPMCQMAMVPSVIRSTTGSWAKCGLISGCSSKQTIISRRSTGNQQEISSKSHQLELERAGGAHAGGVPDRRVGAPGGQPTAVLDHCCVHVPLPHRRQPLSKKPCASSCGG